MVPISRMKSPGVFIDEIDLSAYQAVMDTSKIFGIVTVAQNGPIGEITDIPTVKKFENTFGDPISFGGLACRYLLDQTSSLKVVRAASSSAASRSVTLAATTASGGGASLVVAFKNKGTLYSDAVYATISRIADEDPDKFNLVISKGDDHVQILNKNYTCVADNASDEFPYIIDDTKTEFTFTFGTGTTAIASVTPVSNSVFTTGNNGTELSDAEKRHFIDLFDDSENIDLDIMACPGWYDGVSVARMVTVASHREDIVAIIDTPLGLTAQEAADFVNGLNEDYTIGKIDSTYAAVYHPWGSIYNEYTGVKEWAPPSVGVLPAMAKEYSVYDNWVAPAGIPRLTITIFSEMELVLDRDMRDILYAQGNINPICNYKQRGLTAFGQKTMQRSLTATNRLNVRFLVNYIKKLTDYATTAYLFSEINENTFDSWTQAIDQRLANIKDRGGLYDYKITMDWTTVTDEMLNNNIMPGIIQIKPTKTAEFIPIDVVIRNRSDAFD